MKVFCSFFIILISLELIVCHFIPDSSIRYFTKPSLASSLLLFLLLQKSMARKLRTLLSVGLLFSLIGDVLLLSAHKSEYFFLGGLVSFLVAHVFFIITFFEKEGFKNNGKMISVRLFLVAYAISIFYLISPKLGKLMPYVIIYMGVMLFLVLTAFHRKGASNSKSYGYFLIGALLFMISDSVLALNKFYFSFRASSFLIMLTYSLALLFIVLGGLYKNKI